MDMLQVFHMNQGHGETSYAKNCKVQEKILSLTRRYVEEAIQEYFEEGIPEAMVIADLGCSSGPTALDAVSGIIEVVREECHKKKKKKMVMDDHDHNHNGSHHDNEPLMLSSVPKFMVFLNDLPGNDFNEVFASVSKFQKQLQQHCFVAGLPGSFYGRLLPSNSLHFVHSSSSLHWLSQVPPGLDGIDENGSIINNKGRIYISRSSSSEVIMAYKKQFRKDFLSFLRSRAEEVIRGGRMVFTLMGRSSPDPTSHGASYFWEFIALCLMTMVSEGIVEEEKVDWFNVPYYGPCLEEIKQLVEEESSFREHRIEAVEVEWDGEGINDHDDDDVDDDDVDDDVDDDDVDDDDVDDDVDDDDVDDDDDDTCKRVLTRGEKIAKMHRAVGECMFQHVFGEHVMDTLYHRYSRVLDHHLISNPHSKLISLVVSLIRN